MVCHWSSTKLTVTWYESIVLMKHDDSNIYKLKGYELITFGMTVYEWYLYCWNLIIWMFELKFSFYWLLTPICQNQNLLLTPLELLLTPIVQDVKSITDPIGIITDPKCRSLLTPYWPPLLTPLLTPMGVSKGSVIKKTMCNCVDYT